YQTALSNLNKSLEIEPENASALSYRGKTNKMLGKFDEAISDFKKSLEIEKNPLVLTDYHNQLQNVVPLEKEGGFGTIYQATLINNSKKVALKRLKSSSDFTMELINEVIPYEILKHEDYILQFYGLTRELDSRDIFIVIEYAEGGSMFDDLLKNFKDITWSKKITRLHSIAAGGQKPFAKHSKNDFDLIIKIWDGYRPEVTGDTPECFKVLMIKCWNNNPLQRPNIGEIYQTLSNWTNAENLQFKEAESIRKTSTKS
ncbi:8003_t:CDS:2, partial [Cetraspora pellucida]